jgi:PAS domain S-box-containing protein
MLISPGFGPGGSGASPDALEHALQELSRIRHAETDAGLTAALDIAARALGAGAASLWTVEGGRAVPRVGLPEAPQGDGDEAVCEQRLAELGERCVREGSAGGPAGDVLLDAALLVEGGVTGWVRFHRPAGSIWSGTERLFAAAVADRLALTLERARADAELRQRTSELEAVFHALPDMYFRLSEDGLILDHRFGSEARTYPVPVGFPPQLVGLNPSDFLPADVRALWDGALEEVRRTGRMRYLEYRLLTDLGARDFEARIVPTDDGSLIAIVRDITDRKESVEALRESEARYRTLVEQLPAIIYIASADEGNPTLFASTHAERLLGYGEDEWRRHPRLWLERIHAEDRERVERAWREAHSTGQRFVAEYRMHTRTGEVVWLRDESLMLYSDQGDPLCIQGVMLDITERKRSDEALRAAKDEAERANRAKSEFLSRMSHELRTPMNSILGFAQLLSRGSLAPEHRKSVQHILKAGRHLLHLINEVLEIARIEAGRNNLSLEPVRLGPVMLEAIGLVRPLAAQLGVEVDEGPWPYDGAFVRADRQRLAQVLLNLLSNAVKYNRSGGRVRLACELAARGEGSPRLVVRVEDTGRGIPLDRVDQLFTPFARLGAEQTDVEGTGLGLALSQRLAEAMEGSLTLERTGPEGSVFRLELRGEEDPLERLDDPIAPLAALEEAPHADATILYVEDNLANLSLVETILLSRPRWRIVPALQGQLGVEVAREHAPDLILLDLHLPDIPGSEVLRRLRADARTAHIPVVVISADATRATVERLTAGGANAYLTKPLDIDEFLETVQRFLPAAE